MIKVGIIGGAGYTAGELIRLLLNHPDAEITFVNSTSNAGNKITDVHSGLYGETDLIFTDELPLDQIDLLFFCTAHGDTKKFMESHTVPENVKIIDLSMDYRIESPEHDFVYGLPELNRRRICNAQHIANPGCFATCIQLAVLPLAKHLMLNSDLHVNAITGSTGAGVKPSSTSHFSWRNDNISIYKPFTHQHLAEIGQSLRQLQNSFNSMVNFIPVRGNFSRGIFAGLDAKSDNAAKVKISCGDRTFGTVTIGKEQALYEAADMAKLDAGSQTFTMTVVSGNVSVSGVTVRTRDYAKVPGSISASDYEGVKAAHTNLQAKKDVT